MRGSITSKVVLDALMGSNKSKSKPKEKSNVSGISAIKKADNKSGIIPKSKTWNTGTSDYTKLNNKTSKNIASNNKLKTKKG